MMRFPSLMVKNRGNGRHSGCDNIGENKRQIYDSARERLKKRLFNEVPGFLIRLS